MLFHLDDFHGDATLPVADLVDCRLASRLRSRKLSPCLSERSRTSRSHALRVGPLFGRDCHVSLQRSLGLRQRSIRFWRGDRVPHSLTRTGLPRRLSTQSKRLAAVDTSRRNADCYSRLPPLSHPQRIVPSRRLERSRHCASGPIAEAGFVRGVLYRCRCGSLFISRTTFSDPSR
jgi:hypothetical protein